MSVVILGTAAGTALIIAFVAYCAARSSQSADTAARILQFRKDNRLSP